MIKDVQEHNKDVAPNSLEMEQLKQALPQYFDADGHFQLEKFQKMLKADEVELSRESYELNFLGKSFARLLASRETETVLVPNEEHNADARNADSESIYITGDNLDALKHLAKSYRESVKCIAIDPPYNTGSDGFVYSDTFDFTVDALVEQMDVGEAEAERILDLQGRSSHSAWLTFMLPRLVLARNLLSKDGVFFVFIDDNELTDLKKICDEIFGEDNFVAIAPRKTGAGSAASRANNVLRKLNDYVLIYTRSGDSVLKKKIKGEKVYPFVDENGHYDLKPFYATGSDSTRSDRPNMWFPIYANENTGELKLEKQPGWVEIVPPLSNGEEGRWLWSTRKFHTDQDLLVYNKETRTVEKKVYLNEDEDQTIYQVEKAWLDDSSFRNAVGTKEVAELFGAKKVFDHPKPVPLMKHLINLVVEDGDVVLDFFSGSASTAHAVLEYNAEKSSQNTFIAVQIGEEIEEKEAAYKLGYRTIDEIGRKRIELAADKIKQDTGAEIDYGFKHFTLETPPQPVIDTLEEFNPNENLFSDDPLEPLNFEGTTAKNVLLTTWAVQDGHGLNPKFETITLDTYELSVVGRTAYVIDGGFTAKDMTVLTRLIEDKELDINHLVYFNTALTFEVVRELQSALSPSKLRAGHVTITARW